MIIGLNAAWSPNQAVTEEGHRLVALILQQHPSFAKNQFKNWLQQTKDQVLNNMYLLERLVVLAMVESQYAEEVLACFTHIFETTEARVWEASTAILQQKNRMDF